MPSFFLKWSLNKSQKQTKHPHNQDLIWSQRQKPPIADGTANSEGGVELALFRDESAQKHLYTRVLKTIIRFTSLQSSHSVCVLVCLFGSLLSLQTHPAIAVLCPPLH